MSYKPQIKSNSAGQAIDLPLDAETIQGKNIFDSNDIIKAIYLPTLTSAAIIAALGYTPGTSNFSGDYDDLINKPSLATVATSGSYNDLSDKPTSLPANGGTSDYINATTRVTGLNKLQYSKYSGATDNPTTDWFAHIITYGSTNWYQELALGVNTDEIYFRRNDNGTIKDWKKIAFTTDIPSLAGYATQTWVQQQGYLTSHQDISGKLDKIHTGALNIDGTLEEALYIAQGTITTAPHGNHSIVLNVNNIGTPFELLLGDSNEDYVYKRHRTYGQYNWSNWRKIKAGYADSAGNADTIDGYHASSLAKIAQHNDLTASGNEFTFASSGFEGDLYFNYRTAGGTNGNITGYIFGNGKGGSLGTAIHSGNLGSYLSSLTSRISVCTGDDNITPSAANIELRETNRGADGVTYSYSNAPRIGFHWGNRFWFNLLGFYGELRAVNDTGTGYVPFRAGTIYSNDNEVIHTGNIGSQSVSYASSAGAVDWTNVSNRPTNVSSFTNDAGYTKMDLLFSGDSYDVYVTNNSYKLFLVYCRVNSTTQWVIVAPGNTVEVRETYYVSSSYKFQTWRKPLKATSSSRSNIYFESGQYGIEGDTKATTGWSSHSTIYTVYGIK